MAAISDKANGEYPVTARSKVKRLPARAVYDREAVHAILDEAFLCHVGFVDKHGKPLVLPNAFARVGETLYIHGSVSSTMLKTAKEGVDICVTITLLDGLVVARTAFHHSMNYRSVCVMGKASPVTDAEEKRKALDAIVEHIMPGRAGEVRESNKAEFMSTTVLALPLEEVSAKVRTGPPKDEEKDYALTDVWAGVLPFAPLTPMQFPIPCPRLLDGIPAPKSVTDYVRPAPSKSEL